MKRTLSYKPTQIERTGKYHTLKSWYINMLKYVFFSVTPGSGNTVINNGCADQYYLVVLYHNGITRST